jgi:hypothetical protein
MRQSKPVSALRVAIGIALFCLAPWLALSQTPNYTTPLVLNHLLSAGSPVPYATLCATPADANGNPIMLSAPNWGLIGRGVPVGCGNLVSGALTAPLNVPDACRTDAPAPIYYNVSIQPTDGQGNATADTQQLTAVPNVCGPAPYDLDAFQPTTLNLPLPPATPIGYGVDGVTGTQYSWVVNNGIVADIPLYLLNGTPFTYVLSDTVTATHWAFTDVQGALIWTPIGTLGTAVSSITIADTNGTMQWNLQITQGAIVETPTSGVAGAVSQLLIADSMNGTHHSLTYTNGARIYASAP